MQKRYWLRGGVAFLLLYAVVGVISFILLNQCEDGFECLIYAIPLVVATGPIYEIINDFLPNSIIFLLNGTIWFLVGVFFGWLYGKIKNRNKI